MYAKHLLTDTESLKFEQNGYLILKNFLQQDRITDLLETTDEIAATERAKRGLTNDDRLSK